MNTYPPALRLFQPKRDLRGRIALERSKSLSNRALIIRALCEESFSIQGLSASSDTIALQGLLQNISTPVLDAGAGGTTFRFMTAFLAFQAGTQTLTGSARMLERPVGALVEALERLGARIEYAGQAGFPPLIIGPPDWNAYRPDVSIDASTSSQFVSALLLIAPTLPEGLRLQLEGGVVSRPYIDMTLQLMRHFGVAASVEGDRIVVAPGRYQPQPFQIEADWSAASYFYAFAALSDTCDLFLEGLLPDSLQGDAVLAGRMSAFGVDTQYEDGGARLVKSADRHTPFLEWDFLPQPDLAQTISVLCAAKGVQGLFSGLETLRIKETDRIAALQRELEKTGVYLVGLPGRMSKRSGKAYFQQEGQARWDGTLRLETYGDHRMAMALSMLGCLGVVVIRDPGVVEKSYPRFWEDLAALGFSIDQAP